MADFSMTLDEAILVRDHLRRLGYPDSWDRELLSLAENQIVNARAAAILRWRDHKVNTPDRSGTAREAPSTSLGTQSSVGPQAAGQLASTLNT